MASPGFKADIKDLIEFAKIEDKNYSDSLENALDLIAILNHTLNNRDKKINAQEKE